MRTARWLLAGFVFVCLGTHGFALDRVSFATNWLAEAEHGGFYQALVDGTYERYGLDVNIIQGGPQVNNQLSLAAGRVDFYLGANMIQALHAVEQGIPREFHPAGLRHLGTLCRRATRRLQTQHLSARGLWLRQLFDQHRDAHRTCRAEPRSGAAVCRCLDHRLV